MEIIDLSIQTKQQKEETILFSIYVMESFTEIKLFTKGDGKYVYYREEGKKRAKKLVYKDCIHCFPWKEVSCFMDIFDEKGSIVFNCEDFKHEFIITRNVFILTRQNQTTLEEECLFLHKGKNQVWKNDDVFFLLYKTCENENGCILHVQVFDKNDLNNYHQCKFFMSDKEDIKQIVRYQKRIIVLTNKSVISHHVFKNKLRPSKMVYDDLYKPKTKISVPEFTMKLRNRN